MRQGSKNPPALAVGSVKSCTLTKKADKYFITVLVKEGDLKGYPNGNGIGIDMGLKHIVITSDGIFFDNINKSQTIKKLQKKKKRLQRQISRKYLKNKKGGCYKKTKNIIKLESKLRKIDFRIFNIKNDYYNKVVKHIIDREPRFIVLENLKIKNLMKNKHLSKSIFEASWYSIRNKIMNKCKAHNIEVRIADIYYASSKICSHCGNVKQDLTLSDRTYECNYCGFIIDRDLNAAINLKNTKKYKIA